MKFQVIALALLAASACSQLPKPESAARRDWDVTLVEARRFVEGGDYQSADRLLTQYSARNSGSREGREILFWRSLYRLDPANKGGSLASGVSGLQAYLAADSTAWYRHEALVLRRTAMVTQGLRVSTGTAAVAARDDSRSREEDITALRDLLEKKTEELEKANADLEKANAELERIKRRLANPGR